MHLPRRFIASAMLVACGVTVGSCATSPRATARNQPADAREFARSCQIVPAPLTAVDSISIVLESGGIQTRRISVNNDSTVANDFTMNAFSVAQIFETLVNVDCEGRLIPGMADRWRSADSIGNGAHGFTMFLPDTTSFNSGAAITGEVVSASLMARKPRVESSALGQTITVRHNEATGTPLPFAHLTFHIANVRKSGVPEGSGNFRVDSLATRMEWTVMRATPGVSAPSLYVRSDEGVDARDLIDRGVHVLQTRNSDVIEYAQRSGGSRQIHALPWDRTYAIAFPGRGTQIDTAAVNPSNAAAAAFRESLAREAVRGEARGALLPAWWNRHCLQSEPKATPAQTGMRRIVYDPADPIARSIAERLVAIVNRGIASGDDASARDLAQTLPELSASRGRVTAFPSRTSFGNWNEFAYIIALPHRTTSACAAELLVNSFAPHAYIPGFIPLIDSRSFLITSGAAPAMTVDWDGILRVQVQARRDSGSQQP